MLKYKKGETIIREGEDSDCAYIIESGMAGVYKRLPHGDEQFVGVLSQSDIFGELGWIDGQPRSATVRALDRCIVRKLTRESFTLLAKNNTQALMPVLKVLVNRLRLTLKLLNKLKKKPVASVTMSDGSL